MTKRLTLGLVAIAAVLFAGAAAWWMTREPSIDHTDRALVARGEPLYHRHCASCHGAKLEGQPDWQSRNAQGRRQRPYVASR
jgi:mono/diheme cytochrome c family protein